MYVNLCACMYMFVDDLCSCICAYMYMCIGHECMWAHLNVYVPMYTQSYVLIVHLLMCSCMHARSYVPIYFWMIVLVCSHMDVYMCKHIHVCTYMLSNGYVGAFTCICVCMHVSPSHMILCVPAHMCIHMLSCSCVYSCVHTCLYVFVCVCIHVCVYTCICVHVLV